MLQAAGRQGFSADGARRGTCNQEWHATPAAASAPCSRACAARSKDRCRTRARCRRCRAPSSLRMMRSESWTNCVRYSSSCASNISSPGVTLPGTVLSHFCCRIAMKALHSQSAASVAAFPGALRAAFSTGLAPTHIKTTLRQNCISGEAFEKLPMRHFPLVVSRLSATVARSALYSIVAGLMRILTPPPINRSSTKANMLAAIWPLHRDFGCQNNSLGLRERVATSSSVCAGGKGTSRGGD